MLKKFAGVTAFLFCLVMEELGKPAMVVNISPVGHREICLCGHQFVVGLFFQRGD